MKHATTAALAASVFWTAAAEADLVYRFEGAVSTIRDETFPSVPSVMVGDDVTLELTIREDPTSVNGMLFADYEVLGGSLSVGSESLAFSTGTASVFNGIAGIERFEILAEAGLESFLIRSTNPSSPSLLDGRELPTQDELDGLDFRGTYNFSDPVDGTQLFRVEFTSAIVTPAPGAIGLIGIAAFVGSCRRRRVLGS